MKKIITKDFVFILIFTAAVFGLVTALLNGLRNKDEWYIKACGKMISISGPDNIDETNNCWKPGGSKTWLIDKDDYACLMAADKTKVYRVQQKWPEKERVTKYVPCK